MCGRYRLKDIDGLTEHLRETFGISEWAQSPRYNIAPSQDVPVIIMDDEGDVVVPATMRWGFVPYWEKSAKPPLAPINAQAEKVATNGLFKQAVQKRRCLVPADGFYEWLRFDETTKIAHDIHLRNGRSFFMAGIYEPGNELRPPTFAILTTRANAVMARIHNRMPAIVVDDEAKRWLKPGAMPEEELARLTEPHPAEEIEAVSVSSIVNNPRNEVPECLVPVEFQPPPTKPTQGELF